MPPIPARLASAAPILPLGDTDAPGAERVIALANNENVHSPSQAVLAACARAAAGGNWYPDISGTALRNELAGHYAGVEADRVVLGVGAGELIGLLAQAYCEPGTRIVTGQHGYAYFGIAARLFGAAVDIAPLSSDLNRLAFDPEAFVDAVRPETRIVFVDNPGNPLGTHLGRQAIGWLREHLPEDVLLVLDTAYGDFATATDYSFGHDLAGITDNTAVVSTFSKIHGLAGFRIGWLHAPEDVNRLVRAVQRPGNVSSVAMAAARAALADTEVTVRRKAANAATREWFSTHLSDVLGLAVNPSQTNFVLVTIPAGRRLDAAGLLAALRDEGILVRAMGPYGLPDALRITIGTDEQMHEVTEAIGRLLGVAADS